MSDTRIIDPRNRLFNIDGRWIIRRDQEISDEFLAQNAAIREVNKIKPDGLNLIARLPAAVYEKWLADGFDAQREGARKVIAKLKAEGLHQFLTTEKSF